MPRRRAPSHSYRNFLRSRNPYPIFKFPVFSFAFIDRLPIYFCFLAFLHSPLSLNHVCVPLPWMLHFATEPESLRTFLAFLPSDNYFLRVLESNETFSFRCLSFQIWDENKGEKGAYASFRVPDPFSALPALSTPPLWQPPPRRSSRISLPLLASCRSSSLARSSLAALCSAPCSRNWIKSCVNVAATFALVVHFPSLSIAYIFIEESQTSTLDGVQRAFFKSFSAFSFQNPWIAFSYRVHSDFFVRCPFSLFIQSKLDSERNIYGLMDEAQNEKVTE